MYADLAQSIMALPWAFRAGVGHLLPLLVALYCLYSLRRHLRSPAVLPFVATLFANGWLCWITARQIETNVPGGVLVAVQLTPAVPVLLALVAAAVANKRICWQGTFAGAFWPLYLVDVLCCQKVFGPGWLEALHAVGGVGPLDALMVVPGLAVLLAGLVGHVREALSRLYGGDTIAVRSIQRKRDG